MIHNRILRPGAAGALAAFVALAATPVHAAEAKLPAYVMAAVGSPARPPADTARDEDRKPAEILAFAGVKPGDKVLELIPVGNYYTRLLSKVVGPKGTVYAVMFPIQQGPPRPPAAPAAGAAPAAPPAPPAPPPRAPIGGTVDLARAAEFHNVVPYNMITVGDSGVSAPELVDMVWTSDNYHDFYNPGFGVKMGLPAFNKTVFDALKPGGIYLILDHASAPGTGSTLTGTLHRIDPEQVKKDVLAAGFELDGDSTALAKPGDDRTQRVFGNRGKVEDFVLRFRKPKNAKAIRVPDSEMKPYFGNTLVLGTPEQRYGTVFFNEDHTVQDFGAGTVTYGTWWLDAQANLCFYHQSATGATEVGTMCTPNPFSTSKGSKVGDTSSVAPGNRGGALLAGHVYPNVTPPPPPAPAAAPAPPPPPPRD